MIRPLLLLVAVAVAGVLGFAATRPDTFEIRRTATIQAPAEKIHPLIADLHRFNTWNPFNQKDPQIQGSYRGPASGPGSAYDFRGNQEVGAGSLEILESTAPGKVTMRLTMTEPMPADNTVEFTLVPSGAGGTGTDVTWSMRGPSPYIAKLMGLFFNVDRMVGGEFETGLASLKAMAERN